MKKIIISILDNSLLFKYTNYKNNTNDLLNTNIISNDELLFSDEYLINNKKIASLFLSDLIKEKNITDIIIDSYEFADIVLDLLERININKITFNSYSTITYSLCERISKSKNVKSISCYSIPTFMIELLDKSNIKAESRNEVLFTSNFMQSNNLETYSKMYYATHIKVDKLFNEDDLEDFNSFLSINKYLRKITFLNYNKNNLDIISKLLIKYKKKNILIEVYDDISDNDDILSLKNYKKVLNNNKIKLSLVYSKDYLEKNYLKQVIYTTLRVCSILLFVMIFGTLGYVSYSDYSSQKRVESITSDLKDLLKDEEYINPEEEIYIESTSYDKLLTVNKDTIGWIKVNNTKIDYPVVQTSNNSYYLTRNFYKKSDVYGWVFMDYRNNKNALDKNTIIYAHNNYHSDVMFATLQNTLKSSWYTVDENLYITFNTMNKNMTWKIFSIYTLPVTTDYLYINFDSNERYQAFLDKITTRSDIKLNTPVTVNDRILTLSTCMGKENRLVVHAVLIN